MKFLPLKELEVVGYADPRNANMLPAIMPPIFRFKSDPDRILVPPFAFAEDLLYGATEIDAVKLKALCLADEAAMLPDVYEAKPHHSLWQDQDFACDYGWTIDVRRKLDRLASEKVKQAQEKLKTGQWDVAEQLASAAISADGSQPEPFAIKAAIYRMRGEEDRAGLMQEFSGTLEHTFETLVATYVGEVRPARAAELISCMKAVATIKPAAAWQEAA